MNLDIANTMKYTISRPTSIEPRKIYLIKIVNSFHRIEINAFDNDNKENLCHCYFIDTGTNGWYGRDIIFDCPPQFQIIPKFAKKFSLFRLEDFNQNETAKIFIKSYLMNKIVQCAIRTDIMDYLTGNSNGAISAIFFKTDANKKPINLNQVILEKICDTIPLPTLSAETSNEVQISYVSPFDGSIYCHTKGSLVHIKFIEKVINRLADVGITNVFKHVLPSNINCDSEPYLAFDRDEKHWYRVQILLVPENQRQLQTPPRSASCYFVDYGMTKKISFHNIFTLTGVLSKYPHQALQLVLDSIQMTSKRIERLRQLIKSKDVVYVDLVQNEMCASALPTVIIKKYQGMDNNGELFTINQKLMDI